MRIKFQTSTRASNVRRAGAGMLCFAIALATPTVAGAAAPRTTSLKTKQLVVKIDGGLVAAVSPLGISLAPVAPATGTTNISITVPATGTVKVQSKKVLKSTIKLTGGVSLISGPPLNLGTITMGSLSLHLAGTKGTLTSILTPPIIAGNPAVLDVSKLKVSSSKKITGTLSFDETVGKVLGALVPAASTGKPFGTFTIS